MWHDRHGGAQRRGKRPARPIRDQLLEDRMELKQLRYFLSVSELGSFSKAAVQLSLAQPILNRQIRALEHDLNAELFYRNGRGIVLSAAGKLLGAYAKEIIQTASKGSFAIMALKAAP